MATATTNDMRQATILAALKRGPLSLSKLEERTGLSHREVEAACQALEQTGQLRIGEWEPADDRSRRALKLLREGGSISTSELASRLRAVYTGVEIPTHAVYEFFQALKSSGLVSSEKRKSEQPKLYIPRMRTVVHRGNYRTLKKLQAVARKVAKKRGLSLRAQIPPATKKALLHTYETTLDAMAEKAAPGEGQRIAQFKAELVATLQGTTFTDVLLLFGVRLFYPDIVNWWALSGEAVCELAGEAGKGPRLKLGAASKQLPFVPPPPALQPGRNKPRPSPASKRRGSKRQKSVRRSRVA